METDGRKVYGIKPALKSLAEYFKMPRNIGRFLLLLFLIALGAVSALFLYNFPQRLIGNINTFQLFFKVIIAVYSVLAIFSLIPALMPETVKINKITVIATSFFILAFTYFMPRFVLGKKFFEALTDRSENLIAVFFALSLFINAFTFVRCAFNKKRAKNR